MWLLALVLAASFTEYELQIERDGKTTTRVAQNFWPGEYPGPVINVPSKMTVKAYASVRDFGLPIDCAIKPGIYHAWSQTPGSAIGWFNLVPVHTYTVKADTKLDDVPLKAGEVVTDVVPLAEGNCRGQLGRGKQRKAIEFQCAELDETSAIEHTAGAGDTFNEQWIHLKCADGKKAFIRDEALRKVPGVTDGQIISYGKVGP